MRFLPAKLFIGTLLLAAAVNVGAQQDKPGNLQPLPVAPPPPPGVTDLSAEPEVTIRPRAPDGNLVEEYRIKGKLYMIKVTPKTGVPYYLVDRRGDGNFMRQGPGDPKLVVPQWLLLQF
jgi:Protein of unknown function (DUF2782)